MPYRVFGGAPSDVVSDSSGNILGGVHLKAYNLPTGGIQITDIRNAFDSVPSNLVVSDDTSVNRGRIQFEAPDKYHVLYLDAGTGLRWAVPARDSFSAAMDAVEQSGKALELASHSVSDEMLAREINRAREEFRSWASRARSLSNAKVLTVFPVWQYPNVTYVAMQGFSVNPDEDEMYCIFGASTDTTQRLEVHKISTGELVTYKLLDAEPGSYSESLPWFKNSEEELCFIVWLESTPTGMSSYRIFNFDTGVMGNKIPIRGRVRGDHYGNQFVTSDAYGKRATEFYIYNWDSIKQGTPVLVSTVPMSNAGAMPMKAQGSTTLGDRFYLYGGDYTQEATLEEYTSLGVLSNIYYWPRSEVAKVIDNTSEWRIVDSSFEWEAEGITNHNNSIFTGHYVSGLNMPNEDGYKYIVILEHGDPSSVEMHAQTVPDYQPSTGWEKMTIASGCKEMQPFEFRRNGDEVYIRGRVGPSVGTTFPEGKKQIIGYIPGIKPARPQQFPGTSQGALPKMMKINIEVSGEVAVYADNDWDYADLSTVGPVYLS